jgi:glycosyltransferase involved in cell wall biosynthesis
MKTKLLIINSTLERSGLTNVIYNLVKYLDATKYDVSILTLSKEPAFSRENDFKVLQINTIKLELKRSTLSFYLAKKLRQEVAKIAPDIIQTFSYRGTLYSYKYLRNYKRAVTIQGDLLQNHSDVYGQWIGSYFTRNEIKAFDNASAKILCSKSLLSVYGDIKHVKVIRNGVDDITYHKVESDKKSDLKKRLGLSLDYAIISVGSLSDRKDPLTIIKAFLNSNKSKTSHLIFLGDGPLMTDCVQMANGYDNILFKGNVSNVDEYYQSSDVFVSASKSEGLPNTVIEASLCGLKCVLSDIPQHREVFDGFENEASFFQVSDFEKLSTLFNEIEHKSLLFQQILTARNMAIEYQKIYESII